MIVVVTMEQRLKTANCCLECGRVIEIGDHPFCKGDPEDHGAPILGKGADITWPGGKTFENLGDQPVTFYSPTEKAKYLREHNIEEFVRHQPVPGSDHSPHTTRWEAVPDMDGAKAMLERIAQGKGHDPEPQTLIERWVPATEVGVTRVRGRL
jgi:hypothetical protein